jgi:hypothetical protein
MTFFIDNEPVGSYLSTNYTGTSWKYRLLVYSNETLPMSPHTFFLQNGGSDTVTEGIGLFDYIDYTCVMLLRLRFTSHFIDVNCRTDAEESASSTSPTFSSSATTIDSSTPTQSGVTSSTSKQTD